MYMSKNLTVIKNYFIDHTFDHKVYDELTTNFF